MTLTGKTALITGGARGIGRGCVLALARAGADVAVNDFGRTAQAESVVAEAKALGRRAVLIEGDAFEEASCARIVAGAVEALGRLDVLVSNPAYSRRGDFLDYDPETFAKVIQGTLVGGFLVSRLAARHMVERGGGRQDRLHLEHPRRDALRPQRRLQRGEGWTQPHGADHRH